LRALKKLGARYYSNAAKTWVKTSRVLAEKYGGDPRNLTREPSQIAEVKKLLKDFPYLKGINLRTSTSERWEKWNCSK
jgi:hypothetical protein